MLKRILVFILALLMIFTVIGCDSTDEAYIYMELNETLTTLDPQTAKSETELLIVKNIFEGLLRKDKDGKIVCGAAESYSKNGLTYTFKLKEDLKWSDGTSLTSEDFAFGLKRALLPETKSPFASRLYSIVGAKALHTSGGSISALGIKTPDKRTITITLAYEDADFEEILTTSVAMPCNPVFFSESAGQYGLFADHLLSNGSYKINFWRKDPFSVKLYKNTNYSGKFVSKNAAVFFTCDKDETPFERLTQNDVDIAFIRTDEIGKAEESGLNNKEIENICWFLTIGEEFTPNMKKSLSMLVGGEIYSSSLKTGYRVANTIYPSVLNQEFTANGITVYNLEGGKSIYLDEIKKYKDKKFPSNVTLYYYDDGNSKSVITDIVGHWQSNLSAFVNIKSASDPSLLTSQLSVQDYQMAFFPVKCSSSISKEYLNNFSYNGNTANLSNAQADILRSNSVIPVMFQTTNISYSKVLTNVIFEEDNGYIDFSFITKID